MPHDIEIYARRKKDRRLGYFSSQPLPFGEVYHALHVWAFTVEWFTGPRHADGLLQRVAKRLGLR